MLNWKFKEVFTFWSNIPGPAKIPVKTFPGNFFLFICNRKFNRVCTFSNAYVVIFTNWQLDNLIIWGVIPPLSFWEYRGRTKYYIRVYKGILWLCLFRKKKKTTKLAVILTADKYIISMTKREQLQTFSRAIERNAKRKSKVWQQ